MKSHTVAFKYSLECMIWSSSQNRKCKQLIIFLMHHTFKRLQICDSLWHKYAFTCVKHVTGVVAHSESETLQRWWKKVLCNINTKYPLTKASFEKEYGYLHGVSLSWDPENKGSCWSLEAPPVCQTSGHEQKNYYDPVPVNRKIHKLKPPCW